MIQKIQFIVLFFVVCSFTACHENRFNPNKNVSLRDYSSIAVDAYRLETTQLNKEIRLLLTQDSDTTVSDSYARAHYLNNGSLLWITRCGVTAQADSLLRYISRVGEIGFSLSKFHVAEISTDLAKMRNLEFSDDENINKVAARLDYNLTKSFLKYYIGQRYGFVNPKRVLNRLDIDPYDSLRVHYRKLFDVNMENVGNAGSEHILSMISKDSVAMLLRNCEPEDKLYHRLKTMLPQTSGGDRERIFVNMERCRWRQNDNHNDYAKYVVVNIAGYELIAVDSDSILQMKVVCGSQKTKTPLLNSRFMRMDLNPRWIVPFNIIKHEISHHAGDSAYFARNNYYITNRSTGERIDYRSISAAALRSGAYRVTQEGGVGNALGRIIFRFDNNFSIYLHDTSTKNTFGREDRSASHGCIRVEKPYELARFLLADRNEKVLEKIKYSMQANINSDDAAVDRSKLLHSLKIEPQVPLFITYYTLYLMPDGRIRSFSDVYGYDKAIFSRLKSYL